MPGQPRPPAPSAAAEAAADADVGGSAAAAAPLAGRGDPQRRRRLVGALAAVLLLATLAGLATGSQGLDCQSLLQDLQQGQAGLIVGQIRAPRTLGAALVGALLGLGGALAQGVFRNPLADPFLLGSASGAGLAVALVLAGAPLLGWLGLAAGPAAADWLQRVGLVLAAFAGAWAGMLLTLTLARGAAHTLRLLLAGVVVGALLGAVGDLVTVLAPDALRGKQAFALGSTSYLGWPAVGLLAGGLLLLLVLAQRHARALDALTLGEDSASSLGLDLGRVRLLLVALLTGATALAVSQAGLVAFIGLVAPHLVRRHAPGAHGWLLGASAAMGAALLLVADLLSRMLVAPQELPLGVVTAVLGGCYLFALLRRRGLA